MVSTASILGLIFSLCLSVFLPVLLIIMFRKKFGVSAASIGIGVLMFVLFSTILESLLHLFVLQINPTTKALMVKPLAYGLYGAFAAGIFEETGRLVGFKFLLRKHHQWKDGLSYGIGHGGIEAILIGGLTALNYLIYCLFINNGTFDVLIGSKLPEATASALKSSLVSSPAFGFYVMGIERCIAIGIQLALSVLVLYAVSSKKYRFYFIAILIHAVIDFPAALSQKGVVSVWFVEVFALIACIVGIVFIKKSKRLFEALE